MKKLLVAPLGVLIFAALVSGCSNSPPATLEADPPTILLDQINEARSEASVNEVVLADDLTDQAELYAVSQGQFAVTIKSSKYSAAWIATKICDSNETAVDLWTADKAPIADSRWTHVGLAIDGTYHVALFGAAK